MRADVSWFFGGTIVPLIIVGVLAWYRVRLADPVWRRLTGIYLLRTLSIALASLAEAVV